MNDAPDTNTPAAAPETNAPPAAPSPVRWDEAIVATYLYELTRGAA